MMCGNLIATSALEGENLYGIDADLTSWLRIRLFRVFAFCPRQGPQARVRVRKGSLEPLGVLRFTVELWRFRLTGMVQRATPVTMDEMEAQKRSRGPH